MVKHKDVTYNETRYRIGLLTAADGSWISREFAEKFAEKQRIEVERRAATGQQTIEDESKAYPELPIEQRAAAMATFLMSQLDRSKTAEVFAVASLAISVLENHQGTEVPIPIIVNGKYLPAELEYDSVLLDLVREVVALRIATFFSGSASPSTT
jgi:hypothetical protein